MEENMEGNVKNKNFLEIKTSLACLRGFDCVEDDWLDEGAFGSVVKAKNEGKSYAIKINPMSEEGDRVKYQKRELQALITVKLSGIERWNIIRCNSFWIMKVSGANHLFIQMDCAWLACGILSSKTR